MSTSTTKSLRNGARALVYFLVLRHVISAAGVELIAGDVNERTYARKLGNPLSSVPLNTLPFPGRHVMCRCGAQVLRPLRGTMLRVSSQHPLLHTERFARTELGMSTTNSWDPTRTTQPRTLNSGYNCSWWNNEMPAKLATPPSAEGRKGR